MKFEQLIVFSNVINSLFLVILSIYKINLIFNIVRFNLLFIISFITRRFLKTYMKVQGCNVYTYFSYFSYGFLISILLVIILQTVYGLVILSYKDISILVQYQLKYILYTTLNIVLDIQAMIYSILILILGIKIIILFKKEEDDCLNANDYAGLRDISNEYDTNQSYTFIRKTQIIIIIVSSLLSYFLLLVIQVFHYTLFDYQVTDPISFKSESENSHILYMIYIIILQIPIVSYYFCFFILIRKSYSVVFMVKSSKTSQNFDALILNSRFASTSTRNQTQTLTVTLTEDYLKDSIKSRFTNRSLIII